MPVLGSRVLNTNPHASQRQSSFPFLGPPELPAAAVFPGTEPGSAGLSPLPAGSTPAPQGQALVRGLSDMCWGQIRHTSPVPHMSYPALPSQLLGLVGRLASRRNPTHLGNRPPCLQPSRALFPATSFPMISSLWGSSVHHSCPREAGKVGSERSAPRHQVSSWTGSRGWRHRILPQGRAILVLAASHIATPLPVLPIHRGSGFIGNRNSGKNLSHHREALGISLRSGASPVLLIGTLNIWESEGPLVSSLGTALRREGGIIGWPV